MSTELSAREELLDLADGVLARAPAGSEAEVIVTETATALTRYANGGIHQNVADRTVRVRLRLVSDGRCGVAQTQSTGGDGLGALVEAAETIRAHSPQGNPVHLVEPDGGPDTENGYSDATEAASPEQRADIVGAVCAAAGRAGLQAYGSCETSVTAVAMASSTGLRRAARRSIAELIAVCRGDDGSAYAARFGADPGALDAQAVADEVTERCISNQGAQPVEPGVYEVVLSPYATAEMLEYLGLVGLGGLAVLEERSFMRFGERVMSESVTITDDVRRPELAPLPFDGEGSTTHPVTIIERGTCRAVVQDSVTAARAHVATTGHSFEQPNSDGALPRYLCMEPGDGDRDSMIASCAHGLLITRFWYVRPVHPLRTIITGMTRDGTFLIEGGRVTRPVRDLRFTQSIVEALADVRAISRDRRAARGYFGATLAPWLHLGGFTFSS